MAPGFFGNTDLPSQLQEGIYIHYKAWKTLCKLLRVGFPLILDG